MWSSKSSNLSYWVLVIMFTTLPDRVRMSRFHEIHLL